MIKQLSLPDGSIYVLSPLTYAEFLHIGLYTGDEDAAYLAWLDHHRFSELDEFDDEVLAQAHLEFMPGEHALTFSLDEGKTWQSIGWCRALA